MLKGVSNTYFDHVGGLLIQVLTSQKLNLFR